MKTYFRALIYVLLTFTPAGFLQAQTPAPPPKPWTGNFGGGFAFTDGNSDTTNLNFSFALTHDPKTRNVAKWNGLYLRGEKDGAETIDRSSTLVRDEFTFSKRLFTFGQVEYLRDKFKDIMFLWSPTVGIGVRLVDQDNLTFSLDNGTGGVWERNPGQHTHGSGAYNAAEHLNWKLSKTATVVQSVTGLWQTNDFGNALFNATLGVAASLTQRVELKFEINDIYKTRPPVVTLRKSDLAVITAFVLKF